MVVEAQTVSDELHDQAIKTMDTEGSFNGRVHRDAAELAKGGEREDVGQKVGIVPDSPKFLMSPTSDETWVPPLVWTFN